MSQEVLAIPYLLSAVNHFQLKIKIMITGQETVPGVITEPGGTAGVIIPTWMASIITESIPAPLMVWSGITGRGIIIPWRRPR